MTGYSLVIPILHESAGLHVDQRQAGMYVIALRQEICAGGFAFYWRVCLAAR